MSGSNSQELFHAFLSMYNNACRVYRKGRPSALNISVRYNFIFFFCVSIIHLRMFGSVGAHIAAPNGTLIRCVSTTSGQQVKIETLTGTDRLMACETDSLMKAYYYIGAWEQMTDAFLRDWRTHPAMIGSRLEAI